MNPKVTFNILALLCLVSAMYVLFDTKGLQAGFLLVCFIIFWNPGKVD